MREHGIRFYHHRMQGNKVPQAPHGFPVKHATSSPRTEDMSESLALLFHSGFARSATDISAYDFLPPPLQEPFQEINQAEVAAVLERILGS
jgi:hypothetical protein